MTVGDLIVELKKLSNWNMQVNVSGILHHPFAIAPVKDIVVKEFYKNTVHIRIKQQ